MKRFKKVVKFLFISGFICGILGIIAITSIFYYYSQNVYGEHELKNLNPPTALRIYDRNDHLIRIFYKPDGKKTIIPYNKIPRRVLNAFIAVEDKSFFEHSGIDYVGILRAVVVDIMTMSKKQGASTITQQVAKNLLLSNEKSFVRKIKEMILAKRIEKLFNKNEIIALYLNHIYFGNSNYGIVEAARYYFNKELEQLDTGEIAYLAGVPKNPNRYRLNRYPKRAKKRQQVVLKRMLIMKLITSETYEHYRDAPLILNREPMRYVFKSRYFTNYLLKKLVKQYGESFLYRNSLKIKTTLDVTKQDVATDAVKKGLEQLTQRQGILQPINYFKEGEKAEEIKLNNRNSICQGCVEGVVTKIDQSAGQMMIRTQKEIGVVLQKDLKWVKKFNPFLYSRRIKSLTKMVHSRGIYVMKPSGDHYGVMIDGKLKSTPRYIIHPLPAAQGALLSLNSHTREILAMVGGYDANISQFNRAYQAVRQPGSVFKPFIYAAAIKFFKFTPSTIVYDTPETYRNSDGQVWKPQNFKKMAFRGTMSMKMALTKSVNMVAIKLFDKFIREVPFLGIPESEHEALDKQGDAPGYKHFFKWARSFGFTTKLPKSRTLALGSLGVRLLEITNAIATFPAGGIYKDTVSILSIKDHTGREYFQDQRTEKKLLTPGESFFMVDMMRSVVQRGTATRIRALKRPAAGKTGTTNNSRNTWFVGYTPNYTTGVWVGFDNMTPLGRGEFGGSTAAPIWLSYKQTILKDQEVVDFVTPDEIEYANVNPKTNRLVGENFDGRVRSAFIKNRLPNAENDPNFVDPNSLLLDPE